MGEEELEVPENVHEALQPVRWEILNVLNEEPVNAKEIAEAIGEYPQYVNNHIPVLVEAGFVEVTIDDEMLPPTKYYTVVPQAWMIQVTEDEVSLEEQNPGDLGSTTAADAMVEVPNMVAGEDTADRAKELAKRYDISKIPVSENGALVGAVDVRDLVGLAGDTKIEDVEKTPMPSVPTGRGLADARALVVKYDVVAVLEDGSPVGVLTARELLSA